MKVKQFYNKNQFIFDSGDIIEFQSYDSTIAHYNKWDNTFVLGRDWNYSNTTRKHLYLFINEFVDIQELYFLDEQKNKREYIQKLIDKKIIKFDKYLY